MESKLPTVAGYLCLGFSMLVLLAWHMRRAREMSVSSALAHIAPLLALVVAVGFLWLSSPSLGLATIACAGLSALAASFDIDGVRSRPRWSAAALLFLVFCLATTLAWWRRKGALFEVSTVELFLVQVALIAGTIVLAWQHQAANASRRPWWLVQAAFIGGAVIVLFSTSLSQQPWMLWLGWHHWGAYIGPVELARAGVRLFHDVPVQYGPGPTATLALACGSSCWLGMYWVVGLTSLLYATIMLCLAMRICGGRQTRAQMAIIGVAMFLSLFVWTAYPPNLGSPALTPSVSGLRFLPLALLMGLLIPTETKWRAARPSEAIHAVWILGVLWSPESAFQTTVVWWPYYVWACCLRTDERGIWRAFSLANARLVAWLAGGCLAFLLAYRVGYGVFPTVDAYFAYVLYPPGPLPIDPFGAVWFFGAIVLAGMAGLHGLLRRAPDTHATHAMVVLLLAAYGVASYFLGRSHDNNLLNISVFFVLLLLALRELRHAVLLRVAASGLLAALVAYPVLAGWQTWDDVAKHGNAPAFEPERLAASFSYMQEVGGSANQTVAGANAPGALAKDAADGMRALWQQFHEPVTVIDTALNVEHSPAGAPWSAYHGPENVAYLPSPWRRQFLSLVADRLGRPGWLLVRHDMDASTWLGDYDAVYQRDRQIEFGTYYAIRYVPRARSATKP